MNKVFEKLAGIFGKTVRNVADCAKHSEAESDYLKAAHAACELLSGLVNGDNTPERALIVIAAEKTDEHQTTNTIAVVGNGGVLRTSLEAFLVNKTTAEITEPVLQTVNKYHIMRVLDAISKNDNENEPNK